MTKKLSGNNKLSRTSQTEVKTENDSAPSVNQVWRDRLNKNKLNCQQNGQVDVPFKAASANTHNRFGNTSPSNSARKTKKGLRPG